ncbi:hypothetical protein [Methylorubrum extorquens]|uniref:hypothetical protein n=1 Tax=Methylorubrum extorquens TaxID=408 RepID=UPI001EE519A1|nr:hypothetical protein [Methylorubrum extorquens]MCG5244889.1 hypothetical protein [Methylorubrum extorquens]
MRDAELVLRYFTFQRNWETFSGGMKRAMDSYMETNRSPNDSVLLRMSDSFSKSLENVVAVFGEHSFQRWMPEKQEWRKHALASLYDAQMFALQDCNKDTLIAHKEEIMLQFKDLFSDVGFRKSIDAATNTPALFKQRITVLRNLVNQIIN